MELFRQPWTRSRGGAHMLRIVSQAIPPSNGERYQRAVAAARAALEQAIAVSVPAGASFAERERAILAAANDACRLALETTLQAVAHSDQVGVDGVLYERHHEAFTEARRDRVDAAAKWDNQSRDASCSPHHRNGTRHAHLRPTALQLSRLHRVAARLC